MRIDALSIRKAFSFAEMLQLLAMGIIDVNIEVAPRSWRLKAPSIMSPPWRAYTKNYHRNHDGNRRQISTNDHHDICYRMRLWQAINRDKQNENMPANHENIHQAAKAMYISTLMNIDIRHKLQRNRRAYLWYQLLSPTAYCQWVHYRRNAMKMPMQAATHIPNK